jgi:N-acetyltransferase
MEWGREEERENAKAGVVEITSRIKLTKGRQGRIISCPAECTGKIGSKVRVHIHYPTINAATYTKASKCSENTNKHTEWSKQISALLQTINLSLSSPPLTQECLRNSKVYLFLLPQTTTTTASSSNSSSGREKIVGCVVAQRIATAMAIASTEIVEASKSSSGGENYDGDASNVDSERQRHLVAVDSGTGLFCHPEPLPTPMGIPRLFVPSTYRRQGIANALLTAAAATFIHGCPLDPKQGQVAFTQPTGDGKALMMKWGGGGARIYEE